MWRLVGRDSGDSGEVQASGKGGCKAEVDVVLIKAHWVVVVADPGAARLMFGMIGVGKGDQQIHKADRAARVFGRRALERAAV